MLRNNRDYKYFHDEQAIFTFTEFFETLSYGSFVTKFIQAFYAAKHFVMLGILCISDSFQHWDISWNTRNFMI